MEACKDEEYTAENFVCSMIENYRADFEIEIDGYYFSDGGGYDVSVNDVATDVYDWETEDWEQTTTRREAEHESLFADDEDEVNGNNNENPDDDEDDYDHVATKFYRDTSLPPGCRIVHKLRRGRLTVLYRSGDGKMFSKRENLLANVNKEAVISPASETLLSNLRTPAANIINSTFNNNHDKTIENSRQDDVDNENTSEGSIQEFFGFELERMDFNSSIAQPPECSTPAIPITPIVPPMFKQLEDLADKVVPSPGATSGSDVAKCQPCNLEFPAADIPIHLAQAHGGDKPGTKPRSCTICRNNVLMKVHVLQKHRKEQHPNHVTHNKGRPKKEPSTPVNMSTPKSQLKAGKVSTPSIPSKAKVEEDVFSNEPLNSSAEDIEKIGDFLSKTAPVPAATKSQSKRGPNKTKNKGLNPVGGATPKKKSRSRSLGGEKVPLRKVTKSPKVTPKGKSGAKKLAPVLSDNDPKHPTSSVNLRRKGRHSHDSSMECAMNCALAPCPELPRAEGLQLDADTVIRDLGEAGARAGRAGQEEDAIMSIHSQM